jgi:hypothetical protein
MNTIVSVIFGIALVSLGLLWFLQGADVLHLEPILCVANCEPLVGGSTNWMIAGIIATVVGALLIRWGFNHRRTHRAVRG